MNIWKWRSAKQKAGTASQPLPGIELQIEEPFSIRFGPDQNSVVEKLEIGATAPGHLQCVWIAPHRRVTLRLSADQARWLATALNHWADSADKIPQH
jgi:hypothetical protein